MRKKSTGMKVFTVFNYLFLAFLAVSCLLPIVNQLAISFSSSAAVAAGEVGLWPVDFTLDSYKYMADKAEYWKSLLVSVERVLLAVPMSMLVCVAGSISALQTGQGVPGKKSLYLDFCDSHADRRRPDPQLYGGQGNEVDQ